MDGTGENAGRHESATTACRLRDNCAQLGRFRRRAAYGRNVPRVLPLTFMIAAALIVSLLERSPVELPGVALGSDVLLHFERTAAMFAIVVAVLSVLREAARGRLPTQLSTTGLGYASDSAPFEVAHTTSSEVEELRARVLALEERATVDDEGAE
jgi:hypothetical protein